MGGLTGRFAVNPRDWNPFSQIFHKLSTTPNLLSKFREIPFPGEKKPKKSEK
jgi:hypothetical protein